MALQLWLGGRERRDGGMDERDRDILRNLGHLRGFYLATGTRNSLGYFADVFQVMEMVGIGRRQTLKSSFRVIK